MKNLSTGTGLALLAGAIVAFPLVNRMSAIDQAAHAAPTLDGAKSIIAASIGQAPPEPTIVWYGTAGSIVLRAWSTGRLEGAIVASAYTSSCPTAPNHSGYVMFLQGCAAPGQSKWQVIFDPNEGFNAAADINFDSKVDGDDLGQLLAAWGPAPRHDIPPSDCPLNLIGP